MLTKKVADLLNEQINKEFFSAYLYLEMNNYFLRCHLNGFAHWYLVQSREECEHAMKIYQFLQDENVPVQLRTISKFEENFKCNEDVLERALKHEEYVTMSIHNICNEAMQQKDYRTLRFLDWFVCEQAEEEKNAHELLDKLKLFGNDTQALYLLDQELGNRE